LTEIRNKSTPILSICIPTFNRPINIYNLLSILTSQIDSLNIEIIVTDNSTNNETEKKIKAFQNQHENITYFKNEGNIGFAKSLKKAISLSNGNYIWTLSDDDIPNREAISKIVNLISHDDIGWIFFNFERLEFDTKKPFFSKLISSGKRDLNDLISEFGVWTSFMSASIVNSKVKKHLNEVMENDYYAFSLALKAAELKGCSFSNYSLVLRSVDEFKKHRFNKIETYLFDFFQHIDILIDEKKISYKTRNKLANQFFSGIILMYLCKLKLNKCSLPSLKTIIRKHKGAIGLYYKVLPIYFMHRYLIKIMIESLKAINLIIRNNRIKRFTDFLSAN